MFLSDYQYIWQENMKNQTVSIGADHAGFLLKEKIRGFLKEKGIESIDRGCYSEERADYPDFAHLVASDVLGGASNLGILVCGSGNGISISANKHKGIRSAVCWKSELAALARQHNNANVIALPARFIDEKEAYACIEAFLSATFEGGRHQVRVDKMEAGC